MSLTDKQFDIRMLNRERETSKRNSGTKCKNGWNGAKELRFPKKKRFSRRLLSKKERYGLIELIIAYILGLREKYLRKQIDKFGGFSKPIHWPEKYVGLIRYLRHEHNKVNRRLHDFKRERREFYKNNEKGKFYADYAPHFAAKILGIDVVIVYRICRRFAQTGDILFYGDMKSDEHQGGWKDRVKREQPQRQNIVTHAVAICVKTEKVESKQLPEGRLDIYHRDAIDENDCLPFYKKAPNHIIRRKIICPLKGYSIKLWNRLGKRERNRLVNNEKFYKEFSFDKILCLQ
jgi:hypothetical protein